MIRQRRARAPLYDLDIAGRRIFWVAALAGIIVFGSLMGAMFVGQQFLQNVLAYSPLESGAAILPAVVFMVLAAPRSAKLIESHGARFTLLLGYVFCLLGFLTMLLLWEDDSAYWQVGLGYAFIGLGVGLAGTPASHSLTGSVPVRAPGWRRRPPTSNATSAGRSCSRSSARCSRPATRPRSPSQIAASPNAEHVSTNVEAQLTKSFSSAANTASQYPQYAEQITSAAKTSFVDGANWAYTAGIIAIVLGAALVFFMFPKPRRRGRAPRRVPRRGHRSGSNHPIRVISCARELR